MVEDERQPIRVETVGIDLDADRYWRFVPKKDPGLHDAVQWWLVALAPWGTDAGFALNDSDKTYGRQVWVRAIRWLGEGFQVEARLADTTKYVWVIPPLAPPPRLVTFTEGWETRMGPSGTQQGATDD